jgi:nucleotide-binding universal stress UspA family protein
MNLVTDKTNVRADEVLVAVIGSPQVADLERTLGRCDDAEVVTLLSVVSSPPEAQVDLVVPGVDTALPDLLVAARVEWLQGRADALHRDVRTCVLSGGEVRTIVEEVAKGSFARVVVVGDASASTRLTIARLIELCPGSLLIEPPGLGATRPNVVAAVDPESDDPLNQAIISAAAVLAAGSGGELHLLHAWELAGEKDLLRSVGLDISGPDISVLAERVEAAHHRAFDRLCETVGTPAIVSAGSPTMKKHLIQATVPDAVTRVVELDHAGIVVIGTQGRVAVDRALGGSEARRVAESDAYVTLVVKPDDFESPLLAS